MTLVDHQGTSVRSSQTDGPGLPGTSTKINNNTLEANVVTLVNRDTYYCKTDPDEFFGLFVMDPGFDQIRDQRACGSSH